MNQDHLAVRLLATFVTELEDQVQVMNAEVLALERAPADREHLKALFRVAHTLKGAARACGVPLVEQTCHVLEGLLAQARDQTLVLGPDEFGLLYSAADALADARKRLEAKEGLADSPLAALRDRLKTRGAGRRRKAAAKPVPANPPPAEERSDRSVRVEAGKLDALLAATGQLLVTSSAVTGRPAELEALHDFTGRWVADVRRTGRGLRLALARAGVPPALVEAVNGWDQRVRQVHQDLGRMAAALGDDARGLAQVAGGIAADVRRMRLRPVAEACESLPRVVRDLAAASGKEITLAIDVGDVEADRAVLDGLREAVLHLVRNAVDHGIEMPAERERAGKPRQGSVRLTAALRGGRLMVSIADDGSGLNIPAIRARLARQGLPAPEDDNQLARLLFSGGLSTRDEVTDISGRGVGLDLVRSATDRIRGTVAVSWIEGRGTTFTLECPPTLATIPAILATVDSQLLAIPTAHIERLLRVQPQDIARIEGRDVVVIGPGPVPLVPLARLLPPLADRLPTGPLLVALLRLGDRRLAVVVDALVAEQEIVVRPIWRGRQALPHLSGAAILGNGRVALVLDPAMVIAAGLGLDGGRGLAPDAGPGANALKQRILVVDDSITTRTLEQSVLEAAGYDVFTAVDGAHAWSLLQERGADLVMSDVEMPRMDGFELCRAVRASKRFRALPLILMTALETPEDRAHGLEAGADAYLVKSSFDQQNLLDIIRQLLGEAGS